MSWCLLVPLVGWSRSVWLLSGDGWWTMTVRDWWQLRLASDHKIILWRSHFFLWSVTKKMWSLVDHKNILWSSQKKMWSLNSNLYHRCGNIEKWVMTFNQPLHKVEFSVCCCRIVCNCTLNAEPIESLASLETNQTKPNSWSNKSARVIKWKSPVSVGYHRQRERMITRETHLQVVIGQLRFPGPRNTSDIEDTTQASSLKLLQKW